MNIMSNIKKFIPSASTVVGLATLGCVAYDSHNVGKIQSDFYASGRDADSCAFYLNNAIQNTSMSKIQDKIKTASFTTELDTTWKRFFNEGIGYIKGFTSMLINNIIPLGLGLGAVFTKGLPAKICASGAGLYGAYIFLKNFFGIGTPPGLNKFD